MADVLDANDDPNADEAEQRQNVFERMYATLQDGLVGVLYIMGKDMTGSYFIAVLSMFVDCAQLAALATPTLFNDGETNEYLDPLHSFFNAFQFSQLSHLNSVLVPMALVLVFGLLFNVMYVGYCWIYQIFNWLFLVRVLRAVATILTGVLYIPILTVFSGTIHCAGLEPSQCMIFQPFVAMAAMFFIPFALISTATFFDPRRDGEGPTTMPHARVAVFHQLTRTVLAILSSTLPGFVTGDSSGMLTFWSIVMTVLSAALVYSYVWLQPYYRHRFNCLRAALAAVVFWFSFCFAVSGAWGFDPQQHSPAVLFYGGLFIVIPLVHTTLLWRKMSLCICKHFPEETAFIFGDFEAELRIRFLLEQASEDVLREQRHNHSIASRKKQNELETVYTKASKWYSTAVAVYSKSALLSAMQAQFLIYEMNKPLLARKALLEAEARGARLDIAFAIYKTKKYTEENASQNNDIMTWVACEKYWKLSKFYDRRCCLLLAEFWARLGDSKLQVGPIQALADQLAVAIREASSAYARLVKLKPDDFEVLSIYAGFLECIRNDADQAKKFKTRADVIRTRTGKDNSEGKFNDNDCSVLRVDASGTSQNGIIISANEVTGRIFNKPSNALEGKVISSILLPPFKTDFDDIMDEYLQQGNETYFDQNFTSYVYLNDQRCVMPCFLELKPFSTDGINFQVFVRVKQRATTSQIVLVDPGSQQIIGVTMQVRNNLQRFCALDPSSMDTIGSIIPDYEQRRSEFLTPDGKDIDLKFGGGINLRIKSINLHGPSSPLVDELTFLFGDDGDGPVPLEVFHTDTEQSDHAGLDSNALPKETDDGIMLEGDRVGLEPIREQSETSNEYAGSENGSVGSGGSNGSGGSGSGSDDPDTSKDQQDDKPMVFDPPAHGIVALEDDSELTPLSPRGENDKMSISENSLPTGSFASESRGSEKAPSLSSATSANSVAASRRVFLNSDGKLDPTLNRFRQLYRLFVLLTMIIIVGVYLIRDAQMKEQSYILDFTPKSGYRRYLAIRIAYLANSLYLLHLNLILPSGFSEYNVRKELVKSADELQRLDSLLFDQKNKFEGELLQFYAEEHTWLVRIIQQPDVEWRTYSMFDASIAYASGARFVAEKPLDLMIEGDVDIFFLVHNIIAQSEDDYHYPGFLQALNQTTRMFAQLSKKTQKSMDTVSVTLAATVLLGFFTLLVVMLLPLARGIDKSRVEVFGHLISMPRSVYPSIVGRFTGRLLDVHDESNGDQVHVDTGGGGGATDDKVRTVKGRKGKGQRSGAGENDERSVAAVEAALRASSNRYQIIAKIGVSLLLLIAYFSCTLYWNFQTEHLLEDAPDIQDYSNLRRATILLTIFKIRMLETGGSQNGGFDIDYPHVKSLIEELDAIQQGLLNGDKHRHLKGIIHAKMDKTDHKTLLFENGCLRSRVPEHTGIPCREYQHGVVSDGLLSGYRTWIRNALAYLHDTHVDTDTEAHVITEAELHERLEMQSFVDLSDLEEFYLQPALTYSTDYYVEYEHYVFDRIHNLSLWACVLVVTSLAICFFYTSRLLYQLDNEIKRTRSLVFMIPDDILRTHPKIKAFIYDLARRQAKASRG